MYKRGKMAFCSRNSMTCKRFLHCDGYFRRTNLSNSQSPALPHTFTATDIYHVWPKHIHSGEITGGKEKRNPNPSLEHDTKATGYISGYFQSAFGGIVSSINSSKIASLLDRSKSREKVENDYKQKTFKSTELKGSTSDNQILKRYQAAAQKESVKHTATKEKEKQEPVSELNYSRSDFAKREEIKKITMSLVQNLMYAQSESSIIERTNQLIAHLVEYPDERNTAADNCTRKAIDVLKDLKRSCRQDVKEIINKALVLLGHIGPTKSNGIRILCLDGGGIKGLCGIQILQKIEDEYNRQLKIHGITKRKYIHQMFDYVCGTSTGSLLASMVFLFKVPLSQCKELYTDLGKQMFDRSKLSKISSTMTSSGMYDVQLWENILSTQFEDRPLFEFGAMDDTPKLSGISCITNVPVFTRFIFRTYNLPPGRVSRYPGSCKYMAQEMIRASSAAPTYYKKKQLEKFVHVDGGLLSNNPSGVAIHECKILWPHTDVSCLISLGTGRYLHRLELEQRSKPDIQQYLMKLEQHANPASSQSYLDVFYSMQEAVSLMQQSATDTEEIHEVLSDLLSEDTYFRFNPYLERDIKLDDVDEKSLRVLEADTDMFLNSVGGRISRAVGHLMTEKKTPLYLNEGD